MFLRVTIGPQKDSERAYSVEDQYKPGCLTSDPRAGDIHQRRAFCLQFLFLRRSGGGAYDYPACLDRAAVWREE